MVQLSQEVPRWCRFQLALETEFLRGKTREYSAVITRIYCPMARYHVSLSQYSCKKLRLEFCSFPMILRYCLLFQIVPSWVFQYKTAVVKILFSFSQPPQIFFNLTIFERGKTPNYIKNPQMSFLLYPNLPWKATKISQHPHLHDYHADFI